MAADSNDGSAPAPFEIELGGTVINHEQAKPGITNTLEGHTAPLITTFAADTDDPVRPIEFERCVVTVKSD